MRIIEPEAKHGCYLLVIVLLLMLYFNLYILAILTFFILLAWLFFCSSRMINPIIPNAIVSPISGVVKKIAQNNDEVQFIIKPRFNGRIYAPNDLQNISTQKTHGFYLCKNNALTQVLSTHDTLLADIVLNDEVLKVKIEVVPKFFRFCGICFEKNEALFLEKIGFLNVGLLTISITGKNLNVIVQEGNRVIGGSSSLIALNNVA